MPFCHFYRSYTYTAGCRGVVQLGGYLSNEGPTKGKACKSFLFTVGSLKVENKDIYKQLATSTREE